MCCWLRYGARLRHCGVLPESTLFALNTAMSVKPDTNKTRHQLYIVTFFEVRPGQTLQTQIRWSGSKLFAIASASLGRIIIWAGPWKNVSYVRCEQQVAQRATIAHLSPMCQGQISFQKTYKWAMDTRGLKSNLSELLCLSWLPATLMMSRSKMNELEWRHHFSIYIRLWKIF